MKDAFRLDGFQAHSWLWIFNGIYTVLLLFAIMSDVTKAAEMLAR